MPLSRALAQPRPRPLTFVAEGRTTVGRRERNEDAFAVRAELGLVVLADGMGGYEGGALASQLTVEAVQRSFEEDVAETRGSLSARAHAAVLLAHRRVREVRKGPLAQMGSTVVVVALEGSRVAVAHAGDSRLYLLRAGVLQLVTEDHSFLREIAHRGGNAEELRRIQAQWGHVVTRAIGHGEVIVPDVAELGVLAGDVLLSCSDGLHGVLEEREMADILGLYAEGDACEILLARAIEAGSRDNITACVVRFS